MTHGPNLTGGCECLRFGLEVAMSSEARVTTRNKFRVIHSHGNKSADIEHQADNTDIWKGKGKPFYCVHAMRAHSDVQANSTLLKPSMSLFFKFMFGRNWLTEDLHCVLFRVEPVQQIRVNKLKQNEHAQILRK
jgi:hypothetical protein